jgi:Tol biopolymer transport system component
MTIHCAQSQNLGYDDGGAAVDDAGPAKDAAAPDSEDGPAFPSCLPQTGWIVFDSDRDSFKRDIFVIRADGTGLTRLTNDPGLEQEPSFAPDGKRIAYASDASGMSQIYVLNVETRSVTKVTARPDGADQPAWSPDGTLIAFHAGTDEVGDVYTIHADGTGETKVIPGDRGFNELVAYQHPVFTPDGKSIVADRTNQIGIANLDGSNLHFLIPNGAYDATMPAISLDGHTLAFTAGCTGDDAVAVTPMSTPRWCDRTAATPGEHPDFGPGEVLAFDDGHSGAKPADVFVVTATCPQPFNVTNNPADDRNPRWAPATFTGAPGVSPPK